MAFALTTYDKDDAPWDDTYGRVVARQKIWGEIDEDGKKKLTYFKELEVGPCERELFILGDEDDNEEKAVFFTPSLDYASDLKRVLPKLQCVKDGNIEVRGDYNSDRGSHFVVQFEICNDETRGEGYCAPK